MDKELREYKRWLLLLAATKIASGEARFTCVAICPFSNNYESSTAYTLRQDYAAFYELDRFMFGNSISPENQLARSLALLFYREML